MTKKSHKTAIVLVNFKGASDTIDCIESLLNQSRSSFRIIVCDNASRDGSTDKISAWALTKFEKPIEHVKCVVAEDINKIENIETIDKLTIIALKNNLGFSGANNVGIRNALTNDDTDYVWLLNNDTRVDKNALQELVDHYEYSRSSGIRLGILGSKLLVYGRESVFQGIGGKYNKFTGITKAIGADEVDNGQYDNYKVNGLDVVIGASMFVRRDFLKDVGLMSERYFLYLEENDWCIRAKRKGWQLGYCSAAKVFHKIGKSIGTSDKGKTRSELSDFYGLRNRLIFSKLYYPLYFPMVLSGYILVLINRLIRGQFNRVPLVIKAIMEAITL